MADDESSEQIKSANQALRDLVWAWRKSEPFFFSQGKAESFFPRKAYILLYLWFIILNQNFKLGVLK